MVRTSIVPKIAVCKKTHQRTLFSVFLVLLLAKLTTLLLKSQRIHKYTLLPSFVMKLFITEFSGKKYHIVKIVMTVGYYMMLY